MSLSFDLDAEVGRLIDAKVIELPTYPGIALQLQRLIASGAFNIDSLAKLVESDPALASHVLRSANSAFYRAAQPFNTLPQAILRIGTSELGNIALAGTLGVQALMEGPLLCLRRESWRRSVVGALVCQQLAKWRRLDAGEAFLAGLLHDFGMTIALRAFEVVLEMHKDAPAQPAEFWEQRAQACHVSLGEVLAQDWKLPPYLVEVVANHHAHDTSRCKSPHHIELVRIADAVCERLFRGPSFESSDLPHIAGLTEREQVLMGTLAPQLPSFLEAFDVGPLAPHVSSESKVEEPPTEQADTSAAGLEVMIAKKSQRTPYKGQKLSDTTLQLIGKAPQPLRTLVTVEIGKFIFSATVIACCQAQHEFCVDLKPFALNGEDYSRWKELPERKRQAAA